MQTPNPKQIVPFSYETLREFYQKLEFSSRAKTLQLFMATDALMPTKNPPYPSSIFLDRTQHIVTVLSYLLGYHTDQWVDEAMISFFSTLCSDIKTTVLFNYDQFLTEAIHE